MTVVKTAARFKDIKLLKTTDEFGEFSETLEEKSEFYHTHTHTHLVQVALCWLTGG